jgi:pyruvate formate lyase activating enzyme
MIRNAGKHLEITSLVIPTWNDDPKTFREMVTWIAGELGTTTVLHLSRYHPVYKLDIEPTSVALLKALYSIAREKLSYVYIGNLIIGDSQDTCCDRCGEKVIVRNGYQVTVQSLTSDGACEICGNRIINC